MERMDNVAVYWDFENIHASLCDIRHGQGAYRYNRYSKQREEVDIDAVMEYVKTLGNININKAYGNWNFFSAYSYALQNHAVDLLQLFHRGSHGKNGADIRLAIDIIEDVYHNEHLSVIVVVGGDSDYVAIAQKVRQTGRKIVGIGVRESTNQYWIQSCNEFKFYAALLVKASSSQAREIEIEAEDEGGTLDEAKTLLCRAITALASQAGGGPVVKAAIKPMMTRLDSSFDEANFGFKTFTDFLEACDDLIVVTQGKHDHMVGLRDSATVPGITAERCEPHGKYEAVLRHINVKVVPPDILEAGALDTVALFTEAGGALPTFEDYKEKLLERLRARGLEVQEADVSKFKGLLYKVYAFKLGAQRDGIALTPKIVSGEDLLEMLRWAILKRVLDNIQGQPDMEELARLLFCEDPKQEKTSALVQRYLDAEQDRRGNYY